MEREEAVPAPLVFVSIHVRYQGEQVDRLSTWLVLLDSHPKKMQEHCENI